MTDIAVAWGDAQADDHRASRTPFVWWDTQDPANPGWVLRRWSIEGESDDIALDAADRDDPQAAVAEARQLPPLAGLHPDDLRATLAEAGERRARAERDRAEAMHDIAAAIPKARAAGIGVSDISGLTGMSRRAIYDILGES